jgi:hypothetical protein
MPPESLFQRANAGQYAEHRIDTVLVHNAHVFGQATGDTNHRLVVFLATFATPTGTLP